jgi:hypothetical protein
VALPRREPPRQPVPARMAVGRRPRRARRPVQRGRPRPPVEALSTSSRCGSPPAGARQLQHRRAVRRLHVAAAPRRVARPAPRRRASASVSWTGRSCGSCRDAARSRRRCISTTAAAGPGVHDAALPRRGGNQRAHDRRGGPEVGDRGVQGSSRGRRHPMRSAKPSMRPSTAGRPGATSCCPRCMRRRRVSGTSPPAR